MEFKKYPKIRALGHEENKDIFRDSEDMITIQEKIDGGNFRFYVHEDGYLIVGSRTQELEDNPENKNIKNFRRCIEYIKEAYANKPHRFLTGNIYYGECCIKHTLSYDWDKIPPFLGFDVYDIKENQFRSNAKSIFNSLKLDYVPEVGYLKAKEVKSYCDKDIPISVYAPKSNPQQQAEGVVFKNYNKQIYAKYVREAFKEENAKAFGGTPKYEETDTGKITARYCTNARIDKHIFKLIDDGKNLELALMRYLPTIVYNDIWEEHWKDIIVGRSYQDINLKTMRKIITSRCLSVLKQVITNNAFK